MLNGIAIFSMRGRLQAAIIIALFLLLSLLLPPLVCLAGGMIVLYTLRMGPKEGAKTVAIALILVALLAELLLGKMIISGVFLLSICLPILLVSLVLGYTRSLTLSFLASAGFGLLAVLIAYILLADPATWWQQMINPLMSRLDEQPGWQLQLDDAQTQTIILHMSAIMTSVVATGMTLNLMISLLIGRAWQAALYHPGSFKVEFYQLRFGKTMAIIMVALLAITVLPSSYTLKILQDCLPIFLVLFALQGLSVIHAIVDERKKQPFWLAIIYILLVAFMLSMLVLLAIIGALDEWFNFRKLTHDAH